MAVKKFGQLFYSGSLTVDGYPPIEVLASDFDSKCRSQFVENAQKEVKRCCPNMTAIEMDGVVPKVAPTLRKWCEHPIMGKEVTALVKVHERKWQQVHAPIEIKQPWQQGR